MSKAIPENVLEPRPGRAIKVQSLLSCTRFYMGRGRRLAPMIQLSDDRKKYIEALLLQNYSIEATVWLAGVSSNCVLGVWAGLKRRGVLANGVRPGRIPGVAGTGWGSSYYAAVPAGPAYPAQPMEPASARPYPSQSHAAPPFQPVDPGLPAPVGYSFQPLPGSGDSSWAQKVPVEARAPLLKIWYEAKNQTLYHWFKMRYPSYEGDFGDFMSECTEGFFMQKGWFLRERRT